MRRRAFQTIVSSANDRLLEANSNHDAHILSSKPEKSTLQTVHSFCFLTVKASSSESGFTKSSFLSSMLEHGFLFLRPDVEYTGIGSFATFPARFKRLWNRIIGRKDPVMPGFWPFDTAEQPERSQKEHG
jgi:hypothetical protein